VQENKFTLDYSAVILFQREYQEFWNRATRLTIFRTGFTIS